MRRADLRSRRGLVRLNRADLNSSNIFDLIFNVLEPRNEASGLRLGHDEGRGLVSLDPADHDEKMQSNFEDGKNTRITSLEQT